MRLAAALVLLLASLAGCAGQDEVAGTPSWQFLDTDGVMHSQATAAGEPVVLFFMASWCGSCRLLTQELVQVRSEFGDTIGLYSVSIDRGDDDAKLEAWKERYDQPWPHGRDEDASMQRTFGIATQSSVVVLDEAGEVVRQWGYGKATAEEMGAAIDASQT